MSTLKPGRYVFTLLLSGDDGNNLTIYATEQSRDDALLAEAAERYDTDRAAGTLDEEWTVAKMVADPSGFITASTYDELEVHTDTYEVQP